MTPSHAQGLADVIVTNPDGMAGVLKQGYSFFDPQALPPRSTRRAFTRNHFTESVLLTHAGDGSDRIFVVELPGYIKGLPNRDDALATVFLDIRERVTHRPGAQAGLLTLAFHPQYAINGRFYIYYSTSHSTSRLSEFRVSDESDVDARSAGLGYGIPPDNPVVGNTKGWREEIWAYGLRNPWRFSFDRVTGELLEGDVG